MRGGWENISAEEATELSRLGCYPEFRDYSTSGVSPYPEGEMSLGGGGTSVSPPTPSEPISQPDEKFSEEIPLWTSPVPQEQPPMPYMNIDPLSTLISTVPMQTGGDWRGFIQGALEGLAGTVPEFFQKDQIEAGITATGCVRRPCKTNRRVKVAWDPMTQKPVLVPRNPKVVIGADGKPTVVWACPPKRMNPLNPHALRRAAVRLGRFHNIASTIEKMVQKACRTGIGRGRARGFARASSCGPRKRCR